MGVSLVFMHNIHHKHICAMWADFIIHLLLAREFYRKVAPRESQKHTIPTAQHSDSIGLNAQKDTNNKCHQTKAAKTQPSDKMSFANKY